MGVVDHDTAGSGLQAYLSKLRMFTRNAQMLLLYSGLTGLAFGVFRLLFNFYVLSLGGYDEQFLGLLTSISSAASLAVALPAAYIAERYSHKRIMVITGWLSVIAFAGLIAFPTRNLLIAFNILQGVAMSVRQITAAPFLMENSSPEERQYVFSYQFGLNTAAGFAGNLVGGMLPAWFGTLAGVAATSTPAYRMALGSMIVVSMLAIAPLSFIRGAQASRSREVEMPWTLLWRHRALLGKLILPNWLIGLGAGMMMPFMNLYYRNVFGQSDAMIGYLFASGLLGMAIAQFIAPPLADRMGKINLVVLTQGLSVPFLITLGLAAYAVPRGGNLLLWFGIAWVAYLFRLALMNLSGPVYQTFVLEHVPDHVQALAASLNGIAFQFGWVLSPQLSGWFQTEYGFVPVFATTSILYVIGIAITWTFFRGAEQRERAGTRQPAGSPAK